MTELPITPAQANLQIALVQANAETTSSSDLYVRLQQLRLPSELTMRLHELGKQTQSIGSQAISVGKIIVLKIIEFVEAHPNLFIGAALGAAVGILVNSVPFFGPFLSPIATLIAMTFGAVVGHRMDKGQTEKEVGAVDLTENVIEMAKDFFQFLIDIFVTVYQSEFAPGV